MDEEHDDKRAGGRAERLHPGVMGGEGERGRNVCGCGSWRGGWDEQKRDILRCGVEFEMVCDMIAFL